MHCFCNKFFKLIKFFMIFAISVCLVGSTKSYSLVDADKVAEILAWAAGSAFTAHEDSWDTPIISVPSLSIGLSATLSPSLSVGSVFTPSPSPSPSISPLDVQTSRLSASPFVPSSPELMTDRFVISKVESFGEKQFLLSISRGYNNFFEKFRLGQVPSSQYRLLKNPKIFQFFKYAVLVRLFEYAIERVRLENVDEYRNKWWYDMIFSCTDGEVYYYNMLYPDFEQHNLFKALELTI